MGSGKGVKSKRFYQFKPAVDFGRWTSSRECLGGGQLVQRGAKPKNGAGNVLPYIEIAIFHSSKGGLRARVTEHLHPNLVFTKPLGTANSFWAVESSLYPPPPPYGDVTRKGLGIKALSIFSFTCCLPLDIKSLVNKIPFLGTSSGKRGCYFSYPLSSFSQIEMRPLSRGKTTHVLHLSRVS